MLKTTLILATLFTTLSLQAADIYPEQRNDRDNERNGLAAVANVGLTGNCHSCVDLQLTDDTNPKQDPNSTSSSQGTGN